MKLYIIFLVLLFGLSFDAFAQTNLSFEQGLNGWHTAGDVSTDQNHAHNGQVCARMGDGYGSISRRLPVKPLAVVQFNAYVWSENKGVKGYAFISFYNANSQKLLEYKSSATDSVTYQQTGYYTEAPPGSAWMEVGIAKDSLDKGYIYVDDFTTDAHSGEPAVKHKPMVSFDHYMRPLWHSDTIFNETILLYSADGQAANGKLLYQPDHILSVESYDLKHSYTEGKDYTFSGKTITRTANSPMPYRADASFDAKDLNWNNTQSQWVVVTYTHRDQWNGPVPGYKGNLLPRTMAKLHAKKPLTIVAYGMSITRGMDVSGYDNVPPYMPTYVDLFARQLRKAYRDEHVKLYNAGLPGSVVTWGAQYADQYVNPLKPDLVILDFGMNDFWRLTPGEFRGYIQTIMKKVKAANPKVEFILLSNMKFDPAYVLDSDKNKAFYTGNLEGYSHALKQMQTKGAANLDMYSISGELYHDKKAKDCIVNPMHPNDYLARWYAQGLSALLIRHYSDK